FLISFFFFSWAYSGCKDPVATHVAGKLETCKILLDEQNWADAIEACKDLESDEGKHLAAIAYMGRSGLTMISMMTALSDSSNTPTALIFEKIPDDTKISDFKKALYKIMGEIEVKDQSMYLEAVLLSSLLIFKELKALLGLSLVNGTISTCAGEPANLENCSFAPRIVDISSDAFQGTDVIPGFFAFGGLGSSFYQGIAGDLSSDTVVTDTTTDTSSELNLVLVSDPVYGTVTVDVTYDVTVDSAQISTNSALYYNKLASTAYAVSGTVDLSSLDFYSRMDTGANFSITVSPIPDPIAFCNTGAITPPEASDDVLNDCEILSFLENPGF
ncbi:MAG: hypothetical protein HQ517_02595, partial [SAR324 cluster bacterium]|nr:hypothetical protein [SAR324 cluster bacterium]